MERAQYMRFKQGMGPMAPGRGGGEITKAYVVLDKSKLATTPSNEVMDEIVVDDHHVTLRKRVKDAHGQFYMATRRLPLDCVRDYEPLPEKKKEPTE